MHEPLSPVEAKQRIRSILTEGRLFFTSHAQEELDADDLQQTDCVNVLRGGVVRPAEYEHGGWRYRVETSRMAVIIEFHGLDTIVVVTAWRY